MLFFNHIRSCFRSGIRYICSFIKKHPVQHIVVFIVIIMHLVPFAFYSRSKVPMSQAAKKLQISTYTLPQKIIPKNISKSTVSAKRQKKIISSTDSAISSKHISKNTMNSVQNICKKLQQMEQTTITGSNTLPLPRLSNQSIYPTESILVSYQESLLEYLEKNIFLPEQGIVDLQITLSDNGKPISIKIIHSTSKINADFLCTELEKHTFPPFLKNATIEKEKTFILSFQSNIT